jgi:hypothetical protein
MKWLVNRPTGEILVIMIAFTICGGVAVGGVGIIVFMFLNPNSETLAATRLIAGVMNTLIGLLAGFLAGATQARNTTRGSDAPPDNQ